MHNNKTTDDVAVGLSAMTLLTLIVLLLVTGLTSGCSSSTGWRISFGVAPVSQIRDVASLQGNQSTTTAIKRVPAKSSVTNPEEDY